MEIQTFFLADEIIQADQNNFNGNLVGIHTFNISEVEFPIEIAPYIFLQLRRGSAEEELEIRYKIRVIDEDGNPVKALSANDFITPWPKGNKFKTIFGPLNMNIPHVGDYFLEVLLPDSAVEISRTYHFDVQFAKQ